MTKREGKKGKCCFYWQRRGFPLVRLPDDPRSSEFIYLVNDLNRQADVKKENEKLERRIVTPGTLSGHSIDSTQKILDTYIPRYMELAKEGIRCWKNASGTKV